MDTNQSITILKSLANGIDPSSGEVFAMDSAYNNPMIIRALFGCLDIIKSPPKKTKRTLEEKQADNVAKSLPRNANLPWTNELRLELADQFNAAIKPSELAQKFERTYGSIIAQLKGQGLISEDEARNYNNR